MGFFALAFFLTAAVLAFFIILFGLGTAVFVFFTAAFALGVDALTFFAAGFLGVAAVFVLFATLFRGEPSTGLFCTASFGVAASFIPFLEDAILLLGLLIVFMDAVWVKAFLEAVERFSPVFFLGLATLVLVASLLGVMRVPIVYIIEPG